MGQRDTEHSGNSLAQHIGGRIAWWDRLLHGEGEGDGWIEMSARYGPEDQN